ncbi:MAG: DMT family transporter [Acidimicrobiia bacterium]|nr:DMT family transporter [Acidimicrobiia bacterium]MXZ79435.1 DMT family transporter [Acidimicrobiia bacterium]MXZ86903.1 DMT family transporter [Acidimicrobiia bacterium]MYB09274.1 DMT family transporter [Acidimicrobiia bacterium]MYB72524.1 DMT family transporter [Acidimicrobiia bacterium]
MPVLLGALASALIGVSDYFGRYCSRRAHAMTTVGTAFVGGLGITLVLVLIVPSAITAADLLLGAASGVLIAIALSAMWHSLAVSSSAIASPIVAAFTALGPLIYGFATGERPTQLANVGIAVAVFGLLLAVIVPQSVTNVGTGIAYAVLGGLAFTALIVLLDRTSVDSGMWPAVTQRAAALVVMLLVTRASRIPQILPRSLRLAALAGGIAGGSGMASFIAGVQRGPIGEVSVAGSLYPVVTIALAVILDDDTLRWWQAVGIAAVLAGTTMITIG